MLVQVTQAVKKVRVELVCQAAASLAETEKGRAQQFHAPRACLIASEGRRLFSIRCLPIG